MQICSCYVFEGISDAQLGRLSGILREIRVGAGRWLFQEGDNGEAFYVLLEGAVEKVTLVEPGFELPISILRAPGECLGVSALVPPHVYSLSARCVEDSVLQAFDRAELEQLIRDDYLLGFNIMKNLAAYLLQRLNETRGELKVHFRTILQFTH